MGESRSFTAEPGFTDDFFLMRDFLVRVNAAEVCTPGFLWARWEWAFTLPFLDTSALDRIGVWQHHGEVVGLVTFEEGLGDAWLVVDPARRYLLPAMLDHALTRLSVAGSVRVLVPDDDVELGAFAAGRGLRRTGDGEPNSVLDLTGDLGYRLPESFRTVSVADEWDLYAFHRLLHRGFGHPGEPDWSPAELDWRRRSTESPGQRPELQVMVQAPDGSYAASCGMWWWPGSAYVMVEPVCTDPDQRGQGLGRAAVLEAARRCAELGARSAYVGSDQEFYRRLGFAPTTGGTWWQVAPAP